MGVMSQRGMLFFRVLRHGGMNLLDKRPELSDQVAAADLEDII